jgi:hypothetical protein
MLLNAPKEVHLATFMLFITYTPIKATVDMIK